MEVAFQFVNEFSENVLDFVTIFTHRKVEHILQDLNQNYQW